MAYTISGNGQPTPYVYQEYPRRMYKWGATPCSVTSDDERAAREAEGWSIDQVFALPVNSPNLTGTLAPDPARAPHDIRDIAAVEAPRRGRPPKVRP